MAILKFLNENHEWEQVDVVSDGVTFIPSIAEDGTLSWSNNGSLQNPDPVMLDSNSVVIRDTKEEFPVDGNINLLYLERTNNDFYRWDSVSRKYIKISSGGGGSVDISGKPGNILTYDDDHKLYVPAGGGTVEISEKEDNILTFDDNNKLYVPKEEIEISEKDNNILTFDEDNKLYVPKEEIEISEEEDNILTFDSDHKLYVPKEEIEISEDEGNAIEARDDGLYVSTVEGGSTADKVSYANSFSKLNAKNVQEALDTITGGFDENLSYRVQKTGGFDAMVTFSFNGKDVVTVSMNDQPDRRYTYQNALTYDNSTYYHALYAAKDNLKYNNNIYNKGQKIIENAPARDVDIVIYDLDGAIEGLYSKVSIPATSTTTKKANFIKIDKEEYQLAPVSAEDGNIITKKTDGLYAAASGGGSAEETTYDNSFSQLPQVDNVQVALDKLTGGTSDTITYKITTASVQGIDASLDIQRNDASPVRLLYRDNAYEIVDEIKVVYDNVWRVYCLADKMIYNNVTYTKGQQITEWAYQISQNITTTIPGLYHRGLFEQNAAEVEYDNTTSDLEATNVQDAIDELVTKIPEGGDELVLATDGGLKFNDPAAGETAKPLSVDFEALSNKYLDKTSTTKQTTKAAIQVGDHTTNIANAYLHMRKVSATSTGSTVNGACFSVNGDGTASFQHKIYNSDGTGAKNAAILRFYGKATGEGKLQFAVNTGTGASPTEDMYEDVAMQKDVPVMEVSNVDIGAGAALTTGTFYFVYED